MLNNSMKTSVRTGRFVLKKTVLYSVLQIDAVKF